MSTSRWWSPPAGADATSLYTVRKGIYASERFEA